MSNKYVAVDNIHQTLAARLIPTITVWNRLESRPRTDNFDRALKAEVRDALWMLTRQWQMGEFRGDDAGSPIFSKIHVDTTRITRYRADAKVVQDFDESVPLEAKVEQRFIPFQSGEQVLSLDLRVQMGRQWLKLINGIGNYKSEFITSYPVHDPDPTKNEDALICAHKESWAHFSAFSGKVMDGASLYFYLKENAAHHAYDVVVVQDAHKAGMDEAAKKFVAWFENLYLQPLDPENNAWMPGHLEYQFACSAPKKGKEKVMVADEYYHGHLDWYSLDVDSSKDVLGQEIPAPKVESTIISSFMPTPLSFDGMPNTRWWAFEDAVTNFGDIKPDTQDLNKLLLMEFGLIYANDWFLFPLTMDAGSIANVRGMMVTNVFGERIWIDAAGSGQDDNWQRWNMFGLNKKGIDKQKADNSILILPTTDKMLEGKPLEEIKLIRDEVANMVWAVEKLVPLPHGMSRPGDEAATELKNQYQKIFDKALDDEIALPDDAPEYKAKIRYEVMNSVPENWVPFLPIHKDGSNREIQLQRASMPRILKDQPPGEFAKVKPRTNLMREGLDKPEPEAYFIHEEEVPRAGVMLTQSFQRSRWYNGKTVTWLGVRKQTGRGEGSSKLAFDQIVPVRQAKRRLT
ncbi:MAG: hypothetical protein HC819_22830 [Cyclobacteriaceae bacterium]|nr:hypothetical protein [Cyclobacteriaceae bacterium]